MIQSMNKQLLFMSQFREDLPKKKSFTTPQRCQPTLYQIKSADHHSDPLVWQERALSSPRHPSEQSSGGRHQQQQLIKGLLTILQYNKTCEMFQHEKKKVFGSTNPEDSDKKIKLKHRGSSSFEETIDQIICESKDFDEMLSFLDVALKEEERGGTIEEENFLSSWRNRQELRTIQKYSELEKSIQELFPKKQTVTLPIFTTIEADLDNKEIRLADIDQRENMCLLDKDHYLHVIKQGSLKAINTKTDPKEKPVDLRWVNPEVILLMTSHNKVTFYRSSNLRVLEVSKSSKEHLFAHQLHISDLNLSTEVLLLTCASSQLSLLRANIVQTSVVFKKHIILNGIEPVKSLSIVFTEKKQEKQRMSEQQKIEYEPQYYGLNHNQKSVTKFDQVLSRAGLFWKAPKHTKIQQLSVSPCKRFLLLLLVPSRREEQEDNKQLETSLEYQIVKLNDKGCVLQRNSHCLNCRDLPLGFFDLSTKDSCIEKVLKVSFKMNPSWVRCFSWHNQIYYLSLKSGRIIYKHSNEGEDLKIYAVGESNCLIYSDKKLLKMISVNQAKTKKVIIEWASRGLSDRDSIIHRLSRLQGIPENLLLILRSIRNHDLDLDDIL